MNGHYNQNNGYQAGPPSRPPNGFNQFPAASHPGQRFPPSNGPSPTNQFNNRPPLPSQQYPNPDSHRAPFSNINSGHTTDPPTRYAEGRGRGAFGKIAVEMSLRDQERARMAPRPPQPPMQAPPGQGYGQGQGQGQMRPPYNQQQQQQQGYPQQQQYQQYPPHAHAPGPGPGPMNTYARPPAQPPFNPPHDRYQADRPPPPTTQPSSSSQQYPSYPPGPPSASGSAYPSAGMGGSNAFDSYSQGHAREGHDYARSEGGRSAGRNERGFEGRDPSFRGGPPGPPDLRRNDRENTDRNKLINERISKEKPCRTLFVRNVAFEADVRALEDTFRSYGDVKRFFEMVKTRGMIFITYFDIRAAATARDAQHGTLIHGRPIDVHYSLPQEEETTGRADREKNNGTLMLTLKGGKALNRAEVGRAFERFGDIKDLRDVLALETKVVEYYDARAAIEAYDNMNNKPFQDSVLTVRFVWDDPEITRRDKKGGDRGDRPDRGDPRDDDRERRRVSDHRDRDRARDRERDGGRARSPERTYRRDSYGDRGPAAQTQSDEAEKLRKAKEIERLLNGIGNVQPQAPAPLVAPPMARPPPTLQNFRPPPPTSQSQQGYNQQSSYNAGGQGQMSSYRPNGPPPPLTISGPGASYTPTSIIPPLQSGQGSIRPPYMSPPNPVGQQQGYNGNGSNFGGLPLPPVQAPTALQGGSTPSSQPPNLSADLLAMLAGSVPPPPAALTPASQTYTPTPMPAAITPAPTVPGDPASGSTAAPTGGGDQTAAMSKLLALLVAQQQK